MRQVVQQSVDVAVCRLLPRLYVCHRPTHSKWFTPFLDHPSCHEHAADELAFLRTFDWRCSNCTRCQVCLRTDEDDKMALCDKCDRGLHTYCASPPITVDLKDLDSFICPLCTGQ